MSDHRLPQWNAPAAGNQSDSSVSRTVWPAAASFGRLIGLLLIGGAVLLALITFWRFTAAHGSARPLWLTGCVLMMALAAAGAWLLHGLTTLRYTLDDDGLTISWMREQRVIPLVDIIDVEYDPHIPAPTSGWEPFWPGYYISRKGRSAIAWRAWATQSPRQRVRVRTTHGGFAISPERPIRFIVELDRLRAGAAPAAAAVYDPPGQPAGHTPPFGWSGMSHEELDAFRRDAAEPQPPPAAERSAPAPMPARAMRPRRTGAPASNVVSYVYGTLFRKQLLGDRVASNFVAAGVILPLVMAAYLFSQYEGIPNAVPIHWDALGEVDRVVGPRALWRLPVMAVLILLANTFLATLLTAVDRFLARLLAAAIPIAQIIAFIALVRAVG